MFKLATTLKKGPVVRHHRWRIRRPAVQSRLRVLRRRLAPLALCHSAGNRWCGSASEQALTSLRFSEWRKKSLLGRHQREHLGRFKAETWPRCQYFVVFCRIFGTARSNLTVKATEVFRQVCQSNCKTTGFLRWSAKPIACSACFVVLKRPHNRGYLWPSCIKTIVRPE